MNLAIDASQLKTLQNEMTRFAQVTGRSMEDVLAYEAKEIGWELYKESRKISPTPSKILASAKTRSFRMGRRGDALAPSRYGVSAATERRAEALMEGQRSDYFNVSTDGDGMVRLRRVRFSARKQLKTRTKLSRVLRGGRFGNRFSAGSLRAGQVARFELQQALNADARIKPLNLGAVSAAVELMHRQRAAKGSTIAVQWLPRVWKRSKSSTVKNGPLVVNNRSGFEMGRVDFLKGREGLNAIEINGNVPGTAKVLNRHGIVGKVFSTRIRDRRERINRALIRNIKETFTRTA